MGVNDTGQNSQPGSVDNALSRQVFSCSWRYNTGDPAIGDQDIAGKKVISKIIISIADDQLISHRLPLPSGIGSKRLQKQPTPSGII